MEKRENTAKNKMNEKEKGIKEGKIFKGFSDTGAIRDGKSRRYEN